MQHNARELFEIRRHVQDKTEQQRLLSNGYASLEGLRAVVSPKMLKGLVMLTLVSVTLSSPMSMPATRRGSAMHPDRPVQDGVDHTFTFIQPVATSPPGDPVPPKGPLAASLTARVITRDASPSGPVYSNGSLALDASMGLYWSNLSDFLNPPIGAYAEYWRNCPSNASWYAPERGPCTER